MAFDTNSKGDEEVKRAIFKTALKDSLPVMAGYVVLGTGFGIIMSSNGYGLLFTLSMSLFIYAGSMQYAAVGLLTGGASFLTIALTTLAVNARHLFYGISVIERYKNSGAKKPYLIFALTDETYSLVCNSKENDKNYYFFVSLLNQCYWVTGSVIGSLIGSSLTFNTKGIDFSLTALFITIFVDQWLNSKKHFSAIAGVLISVVCLIIFGGDNFLIPSMILIAVVLLLKMKEEERHEN